jgi:shikimate dehydrogenase
MVWTNKDTKIYCSFAKKAGNTGCRMMNTAFYHDRLNKIYKSFSVDNIEDAVKAVKTLDIKGFAITMPYKKQILKYVDSMEYYVKEIGAANTVLNDNGKLHAYNTDYLAALDFLKDFDLKDAHILGDGGYAAAVKMAFKHYGVKPKVLSRKNGNWDLEYIAKQQSEGSFIFNCTPLKYEGMVNANVETETGQKLAKMQASYQYKLYTKQEFPL